MVQSPPLQLQVAPPQTWVQPPPAHDMLPLPLELFWRHPLPLHSNVQVAPAAHCCPQPPPVQRNVHVAPEAQSCAQLPPVHSWVQVDPLLQLQELPSDGHSGLLVDEHAETTDTAPARARTRQAMDAFTSAIAPRAPRQVQRSPRQSYPQPAALTRGWSFHAGIFPM